MSGIGWAVICLMGAWLLLCHINILILSRWRDRDNAHSAQVFHDLASRVTRLENR